MQVKVRGLAKVRAAFVFAAAAYNIVRLPKLMAARANCARRHEKPENNDPTARQNLEHEPHPTAKNRARNSSLRKPSDFFTSLLENFRTKRGVHSRSASGKDQPLAERWRAAGGGPRS